MKSKVDSKKDKKQENKALRIIMLITIVIAIGILVGSVSYTIFKFQEYKKTSERIISYMEFNSSVEITAGSNGLNADRDGVKFGKTVPGGRGTRFLEINTSEDAFVQIFLSGDLAPYLSVENNSFYMKAGEFMNIPVYLDVPDNMVIGFYTGKVYVLLTRPEAIVK